MKEIYYEIGFLLLIAITNCLAMPTVLENSKKLELKSENPTKDSVNVSETLLQLENNKEIRNPIKSYDTKQIEKIQPAEQSFDIQTELKEMTRNLEAEDEPLADLKAANEKKVSLKDIEQKEIDKQSEVLTDFENDFSLLEDRLPDLTAEEYHEINKEGAMPWNFLKSLDIRREINDVQSKPMQDIAPIYITVPIVINTHSSLPITLSIGGQNIPLNVGVSIKEPSKQLPTTVKQSTGSTLVTPTSIYNKLMDYDETSVQHRPTNRHRSNFRKKIYARHNGHVIEAYEY